jgi:O-antigen/teichoic acid export membrane protein
MRELAADNLQAGSLQAASPDKQPSASFRGWQRLSGLLFYAAMPALSAVNAGVGLLLPLLLEPVAFGRYAVVVTLFQYGLIFDVGLSQLTDRRVPALLAQGQGEVLASFRQHVLWTRIYLAAILLAAGAAAFLALRGSTELPAGAGFLSLAAGVFFMLVLGPASFLRAASDRRAFGRINIAVMLILAVARPVGILLGGIAGCFALLGAAYAVLAVRLQAAMPLSTATRPTLADAGSLLLQGFPLFLTSFIWAFYMTANRWVVSGMATSLDIGNFAFGSNVVTLIVGAVGSLSQFYYPRIVAQCAAGGPFAASSRIRRDFCLMAATVAVPTAVCILAGPALITAFYPKFTASIAVVQLLLLAVPSLVVASWLMPVALSTANRPWLEGLVVYPVALVILLAVTRAGYGLDGIRGAAFGLVASALPLLVLQCWTLRLARLLLWRDAAAILATTVAVTAVAAALLA